MGKMIKDLRVTPNRVGELGTWAEGLTGLKGWLGYTSNPGEGIVYHSNRRQLSWHGGRAGHMCASYLLGVISAVPAGKQAMADEAHFIAQMTRAVQVNASQYNMGARDAQDAIDAAERAGGRDATAVRMAREARQ